MQDIIAHYVCHLIASDKEGGKYIVTYDVFAFA